jgi:hypothetical protein
MAEQRGDAAPGQGQVDVEAEAEIVAVDAEFGANFALMPFSAAPSAR